MIYESNSICLADRKEFPGDVLGEKLKHRSKQEQESYTKQKTNQPTIQPGWLWQSCFPSGIGKESNRHIT